MKSYFVLTTPRTKSSIVYRLLFEYYNAKYPDKCSWLVHYFNEWRYNRFYINHFDENGDFSYRKHFPKFKEGSFKEIPNESEGGKIYMEKVYEDHVLIEKEETQRRVNLLLENIKHNRSINFIKYHMDNNFDTFFPFIEDKVTVVAIDRKDKLNQFLELSLSIEIDLYQSRNPNVFVYPEFNSIKVLKKYATLFVERELRYNEFLNTKKADTVIDHSKMVDINAIYSMLKLNDWEKVVTPEYLNSKIEHEPSYDNLEKYFRNIDKIKLWLEPLYKS